MNADANMEIMQRMFDQKEKIRLDGIRKRQLEAQKIKQVQESGNTLTFLLSHLIKQNDFMSMKILLGQPNIEIDERILYKIDLFNENANNIITELLENGVKADSDFICHVIDEMDPKKCSESSSEFNRCIQTILIVLYTDIKLNSSVLEKAKDRFFEGKYNWVIGIFEMCKHKEFSITKENFEKLVQNSAHT